jgi:hypothetical protein
VSINLAANLTTVFVSGVLIGIAARAVRLLIAVERRQLEAFVDGVRNDDPAATERFERIARRYRRLFGAVVRIKAPRKPPRRPPRSRPSISFISKRVTSAGRPEKVSFEASLPLPGGVRLSVERKGAGRRRVIALLVVVQFVLGVPATLMMLAMVGLVLVLVGSLLLSPLGWNLADPVLLVTTAVMTYLVVARHQARAERQALRPDRNSP